MFLEIPDKFLSMVPNGQTSPIPWHQKTHWREGLEITENQETSGEEMS